MTGPQSLTARQLDCVRVIQDLTDAGAGVGPSIRQIAGQLGTSAGNTHRLLSCLIERGWVDRQAYKARGIRLLHRLSATPPQAIALLIRALEGARPSSDGYVSLSVPVAMVAEAVTAMRAIGALQASP